MTEGYSVPGHDQASERAAVPTLDPHDPDSWGPAVERAAERMAARMWGTPVWYRGVANDALSAALGIDPKDTQRVLHVYLEREDHDG